MGKFKKKTEKEILVTQANIMKTSIYSAFWKNFN